MAETWGIPGDSESEYALCDVEGAVFPPGDFVSRYVHRIPRSNVMLVVRVEHPRMGTLVHFDPVKCKFALDIQGPFELVRVLTPEESRRRRAETNARSLERAAYSRERRGLSTESLTSLQISLVRQMAFSIAFLVIYITALYTRRDVAEAYWLGAAVKGAVRSARFGPGNRLSFENITATDQLWSVRCAAQPQRRRVREPLGGPRGP